MLLLLLLLLLLLSLLLLLLLLLLFVCFQLVEPVHAFLKVLRGKTVDVVLVGVGDEATLLPDVADALALAPVRVDLVEEGVEVVVVGEDDVPSCFFGLGCGKEGRRGGIGLSD
jgi:hypothetical protein